MKLLAASIGFFGLLSGCARGQPFDGTDARTGGQDAAATDAPPSDAPSDEDAQVTPDAPPPDASALLLSEVVLQPAGAEYIELINPGSAPVDLSRYYLADHGNYFRIPAGTATVDSSDFIVKFPQGASIPAHGVVTVAIDSAAAFTTTYGTAPTFAIAGGTMMTIVSNGAPSLTNSGELVVLFYWDGSSDLVSDVDIMLAGTPSSINGIIDKSGYSVDGPDAGNTPTAYAPDARTLAAQPSAPGAGSSTKRIGLEAGEVQNGIGNGLTGDDETTENTVVSWDTSYTAPTPGVVPAALQQ
ncbi:MAG TPA: lamin tail domain-containing protein [Kofleriaceae bacterium]|nr:lamin tail domain-containing protein [Kofleriaceae bacterium]